METRHEIHAKALQDRSYDSLHIVRHGYKCWLIITIQGEPHCFVYGSGKTPQYRHAWQIRNWLEKNFGIPPDSVPVYIFRQP